MAELRDPDLPPGAVVAVDEKTGEGIRNNGKRLKPAEQNPWYVLATIAGVQEGMFDSIVDADGALAARNRRYWNGWACAAMSGEARAALAETLGVEAEALAPLNAEERAFLEREFRGRLGPDAAIPDPSQRIDCRETHFAHTMMWGTCVLPADALFGSASFSGSAVFRSACFRGDACFGAATFSEYAEFEAATFCGSAVFGSATFGLDADFESACFRGDADFGLARFRGNAYFMSARFGGAAGFGSACFGDEAVFESAHFSRAADF